MPARANFPFAHSCAQYCGVMGPIATLVMAQDSHIWAVCIAAWALHSATGSCGRNEERRNEGLAHHGRSTCKSYRALASTLVEKRKKPKGCSWARLQHAEGSDPPWSRSSLASDNRNSESTPNVRTIGESEFLLYVQASLRRTGVGAGKERVQYWPCIGPSSYCPVSCVRHPTAS